MKRIPSTLFLILLYYPTIFGMDLSRIKPQFHPRTPAGIRLFAQAQELIKNNADLNADVNHQGPLLAQAALNNDYVSTALLLLSHGADPDVIDHLGKTPLLYAAELSAYRIIQALIYFGANPNHPCYQARANKSTPLHELCTPYHDSSCELKIKSAARCGRMAAFCRRKYQRARCSGLYSIFWIGCLLEKKKHIGTHGKPREKTIS